ncbi:MAG: hypothetical protein ACX930_09690 [Erythrobacter sp.]
MVLNWLKKKIAESPSTVMTGPGVIKTHNVECRFRDGTRRHGKLGQDRWSDGQERFSVVLSDLPSGSDPVKLFRGTDLVSEFDRTGTTLEFRWKGMSSDDIPKFEIGESLRIEAGELVLEGVVEAD